MNQFIDHNAKGREDEKKMKNGKKLQFNPG
jgi:hypothetical protein